MHSYFTSVAVISSVTLPKNIQYDDAFNGWQVDGLAVHLEFNGLVEIFAHLAPHHLTEAHFDIHAFVAQPLGDIHDISIIISSKN